MRAFGPQELRQQLQDSRQRAAGLQDEVCGMQQAADSLVQQLAQAQAAQREAQASGQAAAARAEAAEQQLCAVVQQQDEDGAQLQSSFQALKQQVAMLRNVEAVAKEQQAALQAQLQEANGKVGRLQTEHMAGGAPGSMPQQCR
jgi:chromosome segregation ATPase